MSWGTPHTNSQYAWYDPRHYDTGASEFLWGADNPNVALPGGDVSNSSFNNSSSPGSSGQFNQGYQNYQPKSGSQPYKNSISTGGGSSGGQVLGATDNSGSGDNGQQAVVSQIDQTYNDTISGLDRMAGLLPGMRDDQLGQIDQSYGTQKTSLDNALSTSNQKLEGYRGEVGQRQAQSVNDLAQNMQAMLQAGNNFLGANKAGNSSAAGMYSYALAQEANKSRADIMRQANDQYNQLNQKALDIKGVYDTQVSQLDQWKASSIGQISNWYNQQLMGIESSKLQAGQDKNNMKLQALQQAMSWMQQLDSQAAQWNQTLQQWFMERSGSINDALKQFNSASNYAVQDINAPELGGISGIQSQGGMDYNPWALLKKKEQQNYNNAF